MGFFMMVREKIAQHSVHPTGGSLRVFRHFAWLEADSDKIALSRPTHQRVTQTVRRRKTNSFVLLEGDEESPQSARTPRTARMHMKTTPSYFGGASCASWRKTSFAARQPSNCGATIPFSIELRVWWRSQLLFESKSQGVWLVRFLGCSSQGVLLVQLPAPNKACT